MNTPYVKGRLLFRLYEPDKIDCLSDIIKEFDDYTLDDLEKLKGHKDHEYFYETAFKKILLNLAKDEIASIDPILTSNIRRGEIVCLCIVAGMSVSSACRAVKLKRNTFYDLKSRYFKDRWEGYVTENVNFAAEQAKVIGVYRHVWVKEHIARQFRVLGLDMRKQETLIKEMETTSIDPYSTTEDTIFKFYDAISQRKQSHFSVLQKKR